MVASTKTCFLGISNFLITFKRILKAFLVEVTTNEFVPLSAVILIFSPNSLKEVEASLNLERVRDIRLIPVLTRDLDSVDD